MRKFLSFFLAVIIGSFLFSCAPKLSEEEAKKVISEHFKYPELLFFQQQTSGRPEYNIEIEKLFAEGYFSKNLYEVSGWDLLYQPTNKGKPYLKEIHYIGSYKYYHSVTGAVCQKAIKGINEILIDKKNNTAIVTIVTELEPIEPFYSLLCSDKWKWTCPYYGDNIKKTETEKVKLKKYDKGWRVDEG